MIAIDGPSGAGKSTIARLLAARLGYLYLDTGAMFRTIALMAKRGGLSLDDDNGLAALCRSVEILFVREDDGSCRIFTGGEDISELIRTPEISLLTSRISAKKVVRDILLQLQRDIGSVGRVILEGRDIGTVVFPDADVKFFLSARPEERGRRRFLELNAKGEKAGLEETIAEVLLRDAQDEQREHAPLRQAPDAIVIDSTFLSIEEILVEMEAVIRVNPSV
ncbi:MAG: (d)CMP kinase [Deltaproteobacteria bacterium]